MAKNGIEKLAVDTIKALAMDAVQKANSGHPGMPMGMAEIAVTLWGRFLKVDPAVPDWPDRDRFVLSNGHGSMLLYSMLHLCGFPLTMDEIKNFRQWGSHTAGHPEIDQKLGIEMTTGPLGQGFATGVGMAIAETHLRARLGEDLVNHRTFGFVSDGDLMEGVSAEAASLAGRFGLGKLIYLYDDNDISIDGSTDITFAEHVPKRFQAQGWHTQEIDGHDLGAIDEALEAAINLEDRPSLVILPHPYRTWRPQCPGHRCIPRLPIGRRGGRPGEGGHGIPPAAHLPCRARGLRVLRDGDGLGERRTLELGPPVGDRGR